MPEEGQESDDSVSRRRFVQAAVAAGITGIAGCGGDGGATATPTDTATATPTEASDGTPMPGDTATPTQTTGGETPGGGEETPTETQQDLQTPDGEPNTTEIASYIATTLQNANHNYFSTKGQQAFGVFTEEFFRPENVSTGEVITSGYTIDTPWIPYKDQIEITTWVDNVRLEPPFDRYYQFDDRIKFWDGTPMTAEVLRKQAKIYWYRDSNWNAESVTFNAEVTGEYSYHEWRDKGNAPGQQPDPTNRVIMESNTPQYRIPIHPDFTTEWYQRLEDASSESKVDSILTELDNTFITLQEFAKNQWGSGAWRMPKENEDVFDEATVTTQRLLFTRWEDHPDYDNTLLDTLRVYLANLDRQKILAQQGKVDIGRGIVTPTGGRINRQILPDFMGQISKALAQGSDKVEFNWHNPHLANLWVRRAIITAVDWSLVSDNGWNLESVNNIKNTTGLIDTLARQTFSQDFLDQLHKWPIKSDMDKAAEYMSRAGYTRTGGTWIGPDGNEATIEAITPAFLSSYYTPGMNTIGNQLKEFGFKFSNSQLQGPQYVERLDGENMNYGMVIQWAPAGPVPNWYWSSGAWDYNPTLSGDPDTPGLPAAVDAEDPGAEGDSIDEKDLQNVPLQVQLPTEIGSIAAPERAGRKPDLQSAGIDAETINLAELVHSFRRPDIGQEEFTSNARKVARFHNYYLPDYYFHQLQFGTWGDLRDYEWAPYTHPINWYQHPNQKDFQTSAGIAQPSWDDDYPEPGTRGP